MRGRWFVVGCSLFVATALPAQDALQQNAERLVALALTRSEAYDTLSYLTDHIGPRLSGSPGAEQAVRWTTRKFRSWGIDVRNEKVMVPRWVRGAERARLVSHNNQKIVLTALGGSVATPAEGITAEIIEVTSLDELKALGRKGVAGKIVFFHRAMDMNLVRSGHSFEAYGKAVEFRGIGADAASEYGAVAALIRSVGSASLRTPHTGSLRYGGKQKLIPAAALAEEDALLVHRLLEKGERVRMHLVLTPRRLPDVASANVVAEIRGSERPDEIVLIGGHLDSWDLGTGAIDNGSGVAMVMETMRLIHSTFRNTKRTIRCVLFMNEENGLRGARAYAREHAAEIPKHVAAIESDAGASAPTGFRTTLKDHDLEAFKTRVLPVLQRVGATEIVTSPHTGADTSPLVDAGVTGFGLSPEARHYFDYHHSAADTLDKVDPDELAKSTAALAALTYMLADGPTLSWQQVTGSRPRAARGQFGDTICDESLPRFSLRATD